MELMIETQSLALGANGAVTGAIWLRGRERGVESDFPELGWSDFPVAVLASWLPALRRLASDGEGAACHFMDGPYHFAVSPAEPGRWRVSCFEDRTRSTRDERPVQLWLTEPAAFIASVTRGARAVLSHCDARGWWNRDTEELRRSLEAGDEHQVR